MALILKLVEWRYKQLSKVFDYTPHIYETMIKHERKVKLTILADKLVALKYISHDERVLYSEYIYWLIKRLIWYGIINYELDKNNIIVTYLYSSFNRIIVPHKNDFHSKLYLLNHNHIDRVTDTSGMQQLIITYYILIDVIMNELIIDVRYEMKKWIYNVMLISI